MKYIVSIIFFLVMSCIGFADDFNPPSTTNKHAQRIFSALPEYARLTDESWDKIELKKMPLKKGMRDQEVPFIRQRLILLDDMQDNGDTTDTLFDEALESGVMRFQWRHGMNPDGQIGSKTLRALNVSPAQRLQQLQQSMQRWSEFPEGEGSHYIRINTANYKLAVVKDGENVMDMRVIVGRPSRQTPEIYSKVETIVLNPKWNVPKSIAYKDIIPKIIKNPNYLAEHNIEVRTKWGKDGELVDPDSIDWKAALRNGFPYKFTQRQGDENALGRVKFLFKNDHAIYMHDTPHKELFAEAKRAYSSGCIRLEKPFRLVEYFIDNDPSVDREEVEGMLSSGEVKYLSINKPIPVYIAYITAWVDAHGVPHFREDIYKRNKS